MGNEDENLGEGVDLGATHALMAFPEPQRSQFCIDTVNALADAVENIMKMKGKIKQAKAFKAFFADFRAKKDEILPVMYYMIKPQFRETFVILLEKLSGMYEKQEQKM